MFIETTTKRKASEKLQLRKASMFKSCAHGGLHAIPETGMHLTSTTENSGNLMLWALYYLYRVFLVKPVKVLRMLYPNRFNFLS